jgi:hypothetical protein
MSRESEGLEGSPFLYMDTFCVVDRVGSFMCDELMIYIYPYGSPRQGSMTL